MSKYDDMKKNLYFIQPEITSGPINEHYLPFSVGCIWAYANQFDYVKNNFELKDVIWRRERQADVLDKISNPDIIGFSCYVWNHNWNLTLAKKIKEKWPNCLIVFGGPSIDEKWLNHKFIDVAMFGEGEEAWAKLLKMIVDGVDIPRYWNNQRQQDISNFPSPYLTGFFDKIIAENPTVSWFMMLETNRGCPYHCTFCGWGADYLNKLKNFNLQRVQDEINWAVDNNIHWMFVIDANSGIMKERDVEIAWMIRRAIEAPGSKIRRVTFNHAKNLNEYCFQMEKIIQQWTYGLEIAIQSMNVPTLNASKRFNIGEENLKKSYMLSRKHGIRYYTELVLGLPLETKETYINGLIRLLELGQHDSIRTYPCTVIPNSEMDSVEYQEKYGIKLIYPKDIYRLPQERIWDEEDNSEETIAMVSSTNSASSEDLAYSLTYSWLLSQFHFVGITQLVSRYLYETHGISYRKYYDNLYQTIKDDPVSGPWLHDVEEILLNYFKDGTIPNKKKYSNIVALTLPESYAFDLVIKHKEHLINLGISVGEQFTQIPESIKQLQHFFIKDDSLSYPIKVKSNIDIDRWMQVECEYQINKREAVSHMHDQMYRKYLIKTDFINLTNPFIEDYSYLELENKKSIIPIYTDYHYEGRPF
jgi:putative methyltransferase